MVITMTDPQTPLRIIGAASGLGAPDARCAGGPPALQKLLQQHPLPTLAWHQTVSPRETEGPVALPDFISRLADACAALLQTEARIAVVGGDHSCAMGTWRGVAHAVEGPLGLVWVDAHLDAHSPASSPSGYWHGMPVAALLGKMGPGSADNGAAVIDPCHLCLVGVRSYEGAEHKLLQRLGVRVISMDEIDRIGFEAAMAEATAIATGGTRAYGVSIDLDALDPADAPAVGSPVVGGIRAAELLPWLEAVAADARLRALEVAEFNPAIDVEQRTLELLLQMLNLASGAEHEPDHRA